MILVTRWFIVALSFLGAAYLVPGIEVASFYTALILSFFWGFIGVIFRPILVLLTLPINIVTLGLFTFVINAFLFWFLGTFVRGFEVSGFIEALLGSLVVTFLSWLGTKIIENMKRH